MGEKPKQVQQNDPYGGAIVQAKQLNERLDELLKKRHIQQCPPSKPSTS